MQMITHIYEGKTRGETCGGTFEVIATNVPIDQGTYSQWDRRLSTKLAMALLSPTHAKSRNSYKRISGVAVILFY